MQWFFVAFCRVFEYCFFFRDSYLESAMYNARYMAFCIYFHLNLLFSSISFIGIIFEVFLNTTEVHVHVM